MTKVLSAVRHRELCKTDFDLDAVPEASVIPHDWRVRVVMVFVHDFFRRFFCCLHQSFAKA